MYPQEGQPFPVNALESAKSPVLNMALESRNKIKRVGGCGE